jgi:prenyltransferase beta subunit
MGCIDSINLVERAGYEQMKARTTPFIIVSILCLFLIAATDKKKENAEFDFKKTSAYTHEIDTRPDFPVSVSLARGYVYSVLALGEKVDPKTREKVIEFVKKLQGTDGGFSIDPATKASNVLYTDFALETLSYLGAVNAVDTARLKSYLSALQRPDGGFSFDAKTKDSSFQTTCYAVHALSYVNGVDLVDRARTAAYIQGFERKDTGGFNYVRGIGVPNVTNTYYGIFALKALGMLDDQTKSNAIKFLSTTAYVGKPVPYEVNQTLEEQACANRTLKMLAAENTIRKNGAVAFIKSFYIPLNGGFGPIHGYGSAPDPTFFGIQALAELGVLKKPPESRL